MAKIFTASLKIQNLYFLPAECIYVAFIILRTNRDYISRNVHTVTFIIMYKPANALNKITYWILLSKLVVWYIETEISFL
jgi:hypothetical protein